MLESMWHQPAYPSTAKSLHRMPSCGTSLENPCLHIYRSPGLEPMFHPLIAHLLLRLRASIVIVAGLGVHKEEDIALFSQLDLLS